MTDLVQRLDPFRRGGDAETLAEAGHRLDDGGAIALVGNVLDEGAVDLDLVERKAAQIAQRRIAGAEVVHRDLDAESAELVQRRQGRFILVQQDRLGDLELEAGGREPRYRPGGDSRLGQAAALE